MLLLLFGLSCLFCVCVAFGVCSWYAYDCIVLLCVCLHMLFYMISCCAVVFGLYCLFDVCVVSMYYNVVGVCVCY